MEIKEIRLVKKADENPDTSDLGQYTDTLSDWCIVCKFGEYYANLTDEQKEEIPESGREYRFYNPPDNGEKEGTEDFQKYGKQDYDDMKRYQRGDFYYYAIFAEVEFYANSEFHDGSKRAMTLKSTGVWGIISEMEDSEVQSVFQDQLEELIYTLKGISFSESDFKTMRTLPIKTVNK